MIERCARPTLASGRLDMGAAGCAACGLDAGWQCLFRGIGTGPTGAIV